MVVLVVHHPVAFLEARVVMLCVLIIITRSHQVPMELVQIMEMVVQEVMIDILVVVGIIIVVQPM